MLNGNRRYRRHVKDLRALVEKLHISNLTTELVPVEHQLAHASSVYHLAEGNEKTAIFCNDSNGEYANIFLGFGHKRKIFKIKQFYSPDSLCGLYAALTDYLGFETLDGEFKVMGLAAHGDSEKYDLSPLARFERGKLKVDTRLITTIGMRRYKAKSRGHYFSRKLVEMLGPRRAGHLLEGPGGISLRDVPLPHQGILVRVQSADISQQRPAKLTRPARSSPDASMKGDKCRLE